MTWWWLNHGLSDYQTNAGNCWMNPWKMLKKCCCNSSVPWTVDEHLAKQILLRFLRQTWPKSHVQTSTGWCFGTWILFFPFFPFSWEIIFLTDYWRTHIFQRGVIELDDGKIYRKDLYLMVKTMLSCRFSLKPIHWGWLNHQPVIHFRPLSWRAGCPIEVLVDGSWMNRHQLLIHTDPGWISWEYTMGIYHNMGYNWI